MKSMGPMVEQIVLAKELVYFMITMVDLKILGVDVVMTLIKLVAELEIMGIDQAMQLFVELISDFKIGPMVLIAFILMLIIEIV